MFKTIKELFKSEPVGDDAPDEAYWQRRHEEDLKDKTIVTRYLVCFGVGHYEDFCGIKEITGHYDKTFDNSRKESDEKRWDQDIDIFYQIDFNKSYSKYGHPPSRCFEHKQDAQDYYNVNVHTFIDPLQKCINDLNMARTDKEYE